MKAKQHRANNEMNAIMPFDSQPRGSSVLAQEQQSQYMQDNTAPDEKQIWERRSLWGKHSCVGYKNGPYEIQGKRDASTPAGIDLAFSQARSKHKLKYTSHFKNYVKKILSCASGDKPYGVVAFKSQLWFKKGNVCVVSCPGCILVRSPWVGSVNACAAAGQELHWQGWIWLSAGERAH